MNPSFLKLGIVMAFARMSRHGLWPIVCGFEFHFQNTTSGLTISLCVSLRPYIYPLFRVSARPLVGRRVTALGRLFHGHTAAFGRPNLAPGDEAEDKKSKRRRLEENAMAREGTAKLQQLIYAGRSIL